MLHQKLFSQLTLHILIISFLLPTLSASHHFFLSLALLMVAHSIMVNLLVLMKWVCYKIIYFVFASFSEVKNTFRNLEIKNLGLFKEFSYDYPISHRNFNANLMVIEKALKILMGIKFLSRFPSKFFDRNLDGNSMGIRFPSIWWESNSLHNFSMGIKFLSKFSMLFRWYFDDHKKCIKLHWICIEIFRWEFD